jgi:GT2 family glycosyltransferase
MNRINISIVLFHNSKDQVLKALKSLLTTELDIIIYLVDNSDTTELRSLKKLDKRINYIFIGQNIGFGAAHNIVLRKSITEGVPYHLVMNPDLYFEKGVLETLLKYMQSDEKIGNLMPKVLYPNGEIQYLCKLLPTPLGLFFRRFNIFPLLKRKYDEKYELRFTGYEQVMNVPYLSGCFMFMNTQSLVDVGVFDEKFFMYLEDVDLHRRIYSKYKTLFIPDVSIYHEFNKASYKNLKLLIMHIKSAIYYFNKWGWIFDKERKNINKKIVKYL